MTRYYLAIDIGASSGRHIVGWREDGKLKTEEVYRFPNGMTEAARRLTWDIDALVSHVKRGIGVEAYTVGSAEFALSYAAFNRDRCIRLSLDVIAMRGLQQK